jgi:hypothetical protein
MFAWCFQKPSHETSTLTSALRFFKESLTCHSIMPCLNLNGAKYSHESSYDSIKSSGMPSPTFCSATALSPVFVSNPTIHQRRMLSRSHSSSQAPMPPKLDGFSDFFRSRVGSSTVTSPSPISVPYGSDAECWERMLKLQRQHHCYNSARMDAAVEELEKGTPIENVSMR